MSETEFERGYRLGQRDASEVTDQFRAEVERLTQELKDCRWNNLQLIKERDAAAERLAQIEALAVALTKKLRECEPYISGAFMLSTVHGMRYQGPSYGKDLEALEAALLPVRGAGEEGTVIGN
jgi:hypothetical protein